MGQAAVGAIPESWVAFTQKDDFWYFWFPLLYVLVLPVLNVIRVAVKGCWKELGNMRFTTKSRALERKNTRALNYQGITSLKDSGGGAKAKISPAKDGVNAHKPASPPKKNLKA